MLDGSCRTPIAGHATVRDGQILFRGQVLAADGSESAETVTDGPEAAAETVGRAAGHDLLVRAPAHLLAAFRGAH